MAGAAGVPAFPEGVNTDHIPAKAVYTGDNPVNSIDTLDLESIAEKAMAILVDSFDFPEAEARQRLTLWKSRQHDLAGQALGVLLPGMSQEERGAALLKWTLEGLFLERDLREGAAQLGIDLVDPGIEPGCVTVNEPRKMLGRPESEPEERPPRR